MRKLTIALAGNPNVGKSTVFNALTGLRQHTGNWPGKTVETARGTSRAFGVETTWIDLPGCYSLLPHSSEETVARDALVFGGVDAVVIVCDANCLERNLNLALQVLEAKRRAVVCVNLMDEARRRGLRVDLELLSRRLGVPVIGCSARDGEGLRALTRAAIRAADATDPAPEPCRVAYPDTIERELALAERAIEPALCAADPPARYLALRLLEGDTDFLKTLRESLHIDLAALAAQALSGARCERGMMKDQIVESLFAAAERICSGVVSAPDGPPRRQLRLDRALTNKWLAWPVTALLLACVFYLTLRGANAPSAWLTAAFARIERGLNAAAYALRAPRWLRGLLVDGVFGTTAWVVAVMLPPMAIFFPLFSLLEEAGFLPRVAFNLDRCFRCCGACGKQGLTMCMGLGCNAVGVTGCRIIDSPREKLIAIVTNALTPCNGRFPTLILLSSLLFAGAGGTAVSAWMLTALLVLSLGVTLGASKLLAATLLRGEPSSFALELPPYRMPRVGKVLARSLLDRTLFVLARAVAVAAPAGAVLWALTWFAPGGASLLAHIARALDPAGRALGMDGGLLAAFLFSFPANEMTLSVALSAYGGAGVSAALPGMEALRKTLLSCGWTAKTALCAMIFCLFHWPCSTTCLTIRRETGGWKWVGVSVLICTGVGAALCAGINLIWRVLS